MNCQLILSVFAVVARHLVPPTTTALEVEDVPSEPGVLLRQLDSLTTHRNGLSLLSWNLVRNYPV
jgi:hypothetical protein